MLSFIPTTHIWHKNYFWSHKVAEDCRLNISNMPAVLSAKSVLTLQVWAAERQRYFGDSIDITDVFQDYESVVEFLISSGHLTPI